MKIKDYKSKEKAIDDALSILLQDGSECYSVFRQCLGEGNTKVTLHTLEDENDVGPDLFIILKAKLGVALIYRSIDTFTLCLFKPEEYGNYTYIFRNVPEDKIYLLLVAQANFRKPRIPLTPREAISTEGVRIIYDYIGIADTLEESFIRGNILKADEEGVSCSCSFPIPILEHYSGIVIKDHSDFTAAVSKILQRKLDEKEKEAAKGAYTRTKEVYFLRFLKYEFFRTEEYSRLHELTTKMVYFGLYPGWNNHSFLFASSKKTRGEYITEEDYVISAYLNKGISASIGQPTHRELSSLTGIPLHNIARAYSIQEQDIFLPIGLAFD